MPPYVAGAGRSDPSDVSPHTFRHSIAFRMIRREDKRLEDVMLRLRHEGRRGVMCDSSRRYQLNIRYRI